MDLKRLVASRRADILRACAEHGATNAALFGSVARGDAHAGSDLDVLVDLEPGRNLLDHIALKQDLEDLLGVSVDVVTRRGIHPLLRDAILAEAVPI